MQQQIYERIYRRLLRESVDLGEIEFSPLRIDGVDTSEPDTAQEEVLFSAIRRWMRGSSTKKTTDMIRGAAEDPKYAEFFNAPVGQTIYRGMALDVYKLKRWLGVSYDTVIGLEGEKSVDIVLGPGDKGGASWSYEAFEAKKFSSIHADGNLEFDEESLDYVSDEPEVILEAETDGVPGHFVDLGALQSKIKPNELPTFGGKSEAEVLQLGPVRVKKIHWWNNRGDDK